MHILHLASEATPWAKTGGLADVVGPLTRYLDRAGHRVTLVLPLYREIGTGPHGRAEEVATLALRGAPAPVRVRRLSGGPAGVRTLAIDVPGWFDREGLYGGPAGDHPDNAERFGGFCRAALAAVARLGPAPDVVHLHDWETAPAAVLLRAPEADGLLPRAATWNAPAVLTVHNLAYQGLFPPEDLETAGLPRSLFRPDALEFHGRASFLKGGLVYADRVTTVSPRYAREIATPEFGCGLEGVIAGLDPPVTGILNGIDTGTWDPATDAFLPAPYDAQDPAGKAVCKAELQRELGLPVDPRIPLFAMVSRLVEQKGIDLVAALRERWSGGEAQLALLGTGEPRWEALLGEWDAALPTVAARVAFSEPLAHRMEAGADFFLMPSRFEPCGLNQMISQRYGTVPVVREVGGLADSVVDAGEEALAEGRATGIVFSGPGPEGLAVALDRALELWARPGAMTAVRDAGMARDFSWEASGRRYERVYAEAVAERRDRRPEPEGEER